MGLWPVFLFILPALFGAGFRMIKGRPRFRVLAPFCGGILALTPVFFLAINGGPPQMNTLNLLTLAFLVIICGFFFAVFFYLGDRLAKPFREIWMEKRGRPKEVQAIKDTFS